MDSQIIIKIDELAPLKDAVEKHMPASVKDRLAKRMELAKMKKDDKKRRHERAGNIRSELLTARIQSGAEGARNRFYECPQVRKDRKEQNMRQ